MKIFLLIAFTLFCLNIQNILTSPIEEENEGILPNFLKSDFENNEDESALESKVSLRKRCNKQNSSFLNIN
jgi:hypothetical protein